MDRLATIFKDVNDWTTLHVLIWMLIGAGLYFTIRMRFVQIRLFGRMIRQIFDSRTSDGEGISSFRPSPSASPRAWAPGT